MSAPINKAIVFLSFMVLFAFSGSIDCKANADHSRPPHLSELIERVGSRETQAREEAAANLIAQRAALIQGLIEFLEDYSGKSDDEKKQALPNITTSIRLLGHYRAIDAIPTLTKFIAFFTLRTKSVGGISVAAIGMTSVGESYAAAQALLDIGSPSIPFMLDLIANSDSKVARLNSGWVLHMLDGPDLMRVRLETHIQTLQDQEKRKKIQIFYDSLFHTRNKD